MPGTTIYLKNYKPPVFTVEKIDLNFDLYEDHALVHNKMRLKRQLISFAEATANKETSSSKRHKTNLCLSGDELELISIKQDGKLLSESNYYFENKNLIISDCPAEFTLEIITRIYPQKNTHLSGLYRSNQLFCTQCEAEGFRRITFYLDRPDVLSKFTTRITAEKNRYPVLLSNGNLIDSGELTGGRHWAQWEDPFKKPCYLFALVAGDLACLRDQFITCSGRNIDLRIYVEPENKDKCDYAMQSLKKAMRWEEEVYGREYDLDILMMVAVSTFNMGAMENKGLMLFNSCYILARPETATDSDFAGVESVVGHEYFHNWTGNRITCRDWFQLSLKEGLTVFRDQEFSRDMNSREVNRIIDVKNLLNTQFPEDAGTMAHPVRPEAYQDIDNFYTATVYEKGAEVIRMQHTLLGAEGFRRGMDLYFARHDGQAVTIEDFVSAMEDANDINLTQFKRWYSQAGTPEVRVTTSFDKDTLTLTMEQSCAPTAECKIKKPFHIPIRIALYDQQGELLPLKQEVLSLKKAKQEFQFKGLKSRPVISLLRGFSAPIKLYREIKEDELRALLEFETDGYAKWRAAQSLALNVLRKGVKENLKTANSPNEQSRNELHLSKALVRVYEHILEDKNLDQSLKAELLTPPGFEEVIADLDKINVDAVEKTRDAFRRTLGIQLFEELHSLYQSLWKLEDNAIQSEAYARRKLRNVCLSFLMKANEEQAIELCKNQFFKAQNMTDQLASFALLVNCSQEKIREQSIQTFYEQWAKDELVLDKWFSIQASCELPGTLDKIKFLLHHPAFTLKNPNKVRALIGTFCRTNHRHFHALDGSGYQFLTEALLQVDQLNPQIAARLANPFTRWQRYDLKRQDLIQNALKHLADQNLSSDLSEIVNKSIQTK